MDPTMLSTYPIAEAISEQLRPYGIVTALTDGNGQKYRLELICNRGHHTAYNRVVNANNLPNVEGVPACPSCRDQDKDQAKVQIMNAMVEKGFELCSRPMTIVERAAIVEQVVAHVLNSQPYSKLWREHHLRCVTDEVVYICDRCRRSSIELVGVALPLVSVRCQCGKTITINKSRLDRDNVDAPRCSSCNVEDMATKYRLDFDTVVKRFADIGLILESTQYCSSTQKLKYRCMAHDHPGEIALKNLGRGCAKCNYKDRQPSRGPKKVRPNPTNE